jgi:hypothetical protein
MAPLLLSLLLAAKTHPPAPKPTATPTQPKLEMVTQQGHTNGGSLAISPDGLELTRFGCSIDQEQCSIDQEQGSDQVLSIDQEQGSDQKRIRARRCSIDQEQGSDQKRIRARVLDRPGTGIRPCSIDQEQGSDQKRSGPG